MLWLKALWHHLVDTHQPMTDGLPVNKQEVHMSALREAVLARTSKPAKNVSKVIAVRINPDTYAKLAKQAEDAGVKPGDIVKAAIEELVADPE
jgi:predicted HicB family RNase H-like nuclease